MDNVGQQEFLLSEIEAGGKTLIFRYQQCAEFCPMEEILLLYSSQQLFYQEELAEYTDTESEESKRFLIINTIFCTCYIFILI